MLSDVQWSLIEKMLPCPTGPNGRPFSYARLMVGSIVYRYRTVIAWRDFPAVFGAWHTVWTSHHRMAADGTWNQVLAKVTAAADAAGQVDWSLSRTPRSPRAHRHATNTTRLTGAGSNYRNLRFESHDHGIGRSRGELSTKIHQLVDGNGLPLVTLTTPGQAGDSPMLLPLMAQLRVERDFGRSRTRPDAIGGDKAYSSRAIRGHLRSRGIKAVMPEPDDQKGHRTRPGSRGGRPVAIDTVDYKNRNVIERNYCRIKLWRGLATRYDKHAIIYRAAVVLDTVIAWTQQLADALPRDPVARNPARDSPPARAIGSHRWRGCR